MLDGFSLNATFLMLSQALQRYPHGKFSAPYYKLL